MQLRDYQQEAINALYSYFEKHDGNPLLVLPTGAGKSVIQAEFQRQVMTQWPDQRILLLTHVKELIEQNADKLLQLWPEAPLGIYAASLNRRDTFLPVIVASIQSVHRRAQQLGRFDLIIIDECHLVPRTGNTMYRRFLADMKSINPAIKIIGMSATPFRLDSGYLHRGKDRIFTDIAYEVPIRQLIDGGYLVPAVTKGALKKIDLSAVGTRAGEFIAKDLDIAVHADGMMDAALQEILQFGKDRSSWLIFCPSVAHAQEVADALSSRIDGGAKCLHGGTPKSEREEIVSRFRAGEIRAVTNCDVLTTGFDAPNVDLIAFLRPTQSAALYIQMTGRGMRIAEGKGDCLVLDFAGNVERHGPVDAIEVHEKRKAAGEQDQKITRSLGKECPGCRSVVSIFARDCSCGFSWPVVPKHDASATTGAILTSQIEPAWVPVQDVFYRRHQKMGKPDSMRVDYACGVQTHSEWICIEHEGYAKHKAEQWFARRSMPLPETVSEALNARFKYPVPKRIRIRKAGKFTEIVGYDFGGLSRTDRNSDENAAHNADPVVHQLRAL